AMADPHAGPQVATEREQRRAALMVAVRRLPLPQAQVVSLVLEDFSHAEIADVLGISVNNVDVRLSRARQALRRELGEPP
ncbi:MAG: RNA polymerase sigma factor, partial [Myxococcales bacterium]|nr:RNA polymerase sigma factor [Myxococcales bacterium]